LAAFKSNTSKFLAYIVIGIVVVSLSGFGIQDVILGSSNRNIAKIGTETIAVKEFVNNLNNEMKSFSEANKIKISVEQAKNYGLVNKVLNDLIARKIIDNLLKNKGISSGDRDIALYISKIEFFKGLDGKFDVEKYKAFLSSNNMKISSFENDIKKDMSRELFLDVFQSPHNLDNFLFEKSLNYYFESRTVNFFELNKETFLKLAKKPSINEVKKYFDKNSVDFTAPNTKEITIGTIELKELAKREKIEASEVKNFYDSNIENFQTIETRLIDVLSFANDEINKKLINQIKGNPKLYGDETLKRKLSLDDVSLGLVSRNDTRDTNIQKLFEFEKTGIYGPFVSDLGLNLYRIRQINPESTKSLEEVANKIRDSLTLERAEGFINSIREEINDEIAAGQTLVDLNQNYPIKTKKYKIIGNKLPEEYETSMVFGELLREAKSLISEIRQIENGSLVTIKLDNESKKRPLTLSEATPRIENILHQTNALTSAKEYIAKEIGEKVSDFKNKMFLLDKKQPTFSNFENKKIFRFNVKTSLKESALINIFKSSENNLIYYKNDDKLMVAHVEIIKPKDVGDDLKNQFVSQRKNYYRESLKRSFTNDYLNHVKLETKIVVNEKLIGSTLSNLNINY